MAIPQSIQEFWALEPKLLPNIAFLGTLKIFLKVAYPRVVQHQKLHLCPNFHEFLKKPNGESLRHYTIRDHIDYKPQWSHLRPYKGQLGPQGGHFEPQGSHFGPQKGPMGLQGSHFRPQVGHCRLQGDPKQSVRVFYRAFIVAVHVLHVHVRWCQLQQNIFLPFKCNSSSVSEPIFKSEM